MIYQRRQDKGKEEKRKERMEKFLGCKGGKKFFHSDGVVTH
jgi:hypothetical protein